MAIRRAVTTTVMGLSLVLIGPPAAAFDALATVAVVSAVGDLAARVLDDGLPALQADRQQQGYMFESIQHLQRGQVAIRQDLTSLARKLDDLGERVPMELRAELDALLEDQVTGIATELISDMLTGTNVISPEIRLNSFQVAISTYAQRRSADVGLGILGWGLAVELSFTEASRQALIKEYESRTGTPLASLEEHYKNRVSHYLEYFSRAFKPDEPHSIRQRLDRERAALEAKLGEIERVRVSLGDVIARLPDRNDLHIAINSYRPRVREEILCTGLEQFDPFDRGRIVMFASPPSFHSSWDGYRRVLKGYLDDNPKADNLRNILEKAAGKAHYHAQMIRLLTSELKRARELFEGLRSVQLKATYATEQTVGLGLESETISLFFVPAPLEEQAIQKAIANARATADAAKNAQETIGTQLRLRAERRRDEVGARVLSQYVEVEYYCMPELDVIH